MTLARDLAWQNLEQQHHASVAYQFARYALALQYEDLPSEVVHTAKSILLDTLGCAIAAHDAPGRSILEGAAKEMGGPAEATVFGSGLRTSAMNAMLVNSLMVRFLDYNDTGGGRHNSDCIAPLLAVAEREKADASAFLTAMVISYELGARVMESLVGAVFEPRGWTADTRAGLSMPGPIGKLMGLNEDQIANAIGLTAARCFCLGILDCDREDMAMAKDLQFAFTAHSAILSCILAKRGLTGYLRVVEGNKGFRDTVLKGEMDLERLTDFSGWRILQGKFKSICQNGTTHACILATLAIVKENDLKPEDITSVRVKTSARDARHVTSTPARKYPRNVESASHSAFFGNAMAIKERALGPDQMKEEKFTDPVILDLIERMTVEADPALGDRGPGGSSEITTKDGRRFFKQIEFPKGEHTDPFTDAEVEAKFRDSAKHCLDSAKMQAIINTVENVEKLQSMGELTKLMVWE